MEFSEGKLGQKFFYHLHNCRGDTKDLLPVLIEMLLWSEKYSPDKLAIPDDFLQMAKQYKQALIEMLRQRIDDY